MATKTAKKKSARKTKKKSGATPTNPALYSRVKTEAKKKFKWPSAYGSAWLVKTYKKRGGTYSKGGSVAQVKTRTTKS